MARERDLCLTLSALHSAGVSILVVKGAALAYSYYARPDLRPRIDTDLLVDPSQRAAAQEVLMGLGYRALAHVSGDLVVQQAAFVREVQGAVLHTVDLHWQIANPRVFARVFSFAELWADARPLPRLGTSAMGLSDVHALVVACLHRVAHHADSDRLIWLFDLHQLASRLNDDQWRQFVAIADERGVAYVCRCGLEQAKAWFGTRVPALALEDPRFDPVSHANEATATFLSGSRPQVQVLVSDLRVLPTWTARARLIREHLFPPVEYMKSVYAPSSAAPLPWLYVRRAWRGARKWLARG